MAKALMYSQDRQYNSYYATIDRTKVLEYTRDTDSTWTPKGHYVSAQDEVSATEELASIIMDCLTEDEQRVAYADFAKRALYYAFQVLEDGSTAYNNTAPASATKSYLIESKYFPNWGITVSKETFSLTGRMEEDAKRLVNDTFIFTHIQKRHPPALLLSTKGYSFGGMHLEKENNFKKCAYFAARKKYCPEDKEYIGFITMNEAQEMSLEAPQEFVESEMERYVSTARGEVFKETKYLLREKRICNGKDGISGGALIEAGDFLGFYKNIEDCLTDNQQQLGICVMPDCIIGRIRVTGYDEMSDLESAIRYFENKTELYADIAGAYFEKDKTKHYEFVDALFEASAISKYLKELKEYRAFYESLPEEIKITSKYLSELKKLWEKE